jgi:hypothetical protein
MNNLHKVIILESYDKTELQDSINIALEPKNWPEHTFINVDDINTYVSFNTIYDATVQMIHYSAMVEYCIE